MSELTADEERELIRRAQAGDRTARDVLCRAFMDFAAQRGRAHARAKGLPLSEQDEAESGAAVAMLGAIEHFDLDCGTRFSTFLDHRIRGAVTGVERRSEEARARAAAEAAAKASVRGKLKGWHYKRPGPDNSDFYAPPASAFWSPVLVRWAKTLRRRNDRIIAKRLWLDREPSTQAEIARELGISPAAVCQRRKKLIEQARKIDARNFVTEQEVQTKVLKAA